MGEFFVHVLRPPPLTADLRQANRERNETLWERKQRKRDRRLRNEESKRKEEKGEDCSSYKYSTDDDVPKEGDKGTSMGTSPPEVRL